MAAKGLRKLVDIGGDPNRLDTALINFLVGHELEYQVHSLREGPRRYYVHTEDLCCAQAVIPALEAMSIGEM